MTDKTIFGEESLVYSQAADETTEAFGAFQELLSEAYDEDADQEWIDFLSNVVFDSEDSLGWAQSEYGETARKDFDMGSSDFPTEVRNGEVVPVGIPSDPESPADAAVAAQDLLKENLSQQKKVMADGQGQKLKQRREANGDGDEPEQDDSDGNDETETEFEEKLTGLYGIGPSNVSEVAEQLDSDVELVDSILSEMDSVESYETADVDPLEAAFSGDSLQDAKDLREETSFSDERIIEIVS